MLILNYYISNEILIILILFFYYFFHKLIQKRYHINMKGIILITGSSTGIGRHITENLSKNYKDIIILAGIRFKEEEKELLSLNYKNLIPIYLDVNNKEHCLNTIKFINKLKEEKNLKFIGLINNAGFLKSIPIEFHNLDEARKMFETNFFSVVNLIQLTLPLLRESKGRIVNISSFTAIAGPPLAGIYAATKGAIESFSDSLRREVAHFGISVSIIEPCYVATGLFSVASSSPSLSSEGHNTISHTNLPKETKNDNNSVTDYRKLYYPLYSSQVEAIINFCVKRSSSPDVTTEAIKVFLIFLYHYIINSYFV